MKRIVKALLIAALCTAFTNAGSEVYLCDIANAVAYHEYKTCRGLNNCKHEIIQVTKKAAIKQYGRRAGKICY